MAELLRERLLTFQYLFLAQSPGQVRVQIKLGSESHRQGFQLVEEAGLDEGGVAGHLHVGVAGEGLLEEDLQLEAGEGGAEAEVAAAGTEGLVLGVAEVPGEKVLK